jgi:hypothetical protein
MKPIEMTVEELSGLEVEKHLAIVTAGIENFAKDEKQMFYLVFYIPSLVYHLT